jgi:citrate synthase
MTENQTAEYVPGLEGIVAARTRKSSVDGLAGQLTIGGFPLEELAANATYEEAVFLLWNDRLPTSAELGALRHDLAAARTLSATTTQLLAEAARQRVGAMDALRMGAATLTLGAGDQPFPSEPRQAAMRLVAAFPTIVATYWRYLKGELPIAPEASLGHAANYLYMLNGTVPSAARARALETYLNTVIDHGLNASTFTARVIMSTGSDMISAVVGAIGALKGPLHGGAPGPALDMVFEIGDASRARTVLEEMLARGERLMGFGHRVYKVRDPRADVLSKAAEELYAADGDMRLYELAKAVEATALQVLEEHKPGRNLQTNVEFFTALVLHGLGLETDLFTPTFAVGRVGGWSAHCFEQLAENRLIRPRSQYMGERGRRWTPLAERG